MKQKYITIPYEKYLHLIRQTKTKDPRQDGQVPLSFHIAAADNQLVHAPKIGGGLLPPPRPPPGTRVKKTKRTRKTWLQIKQK